MKKKAVSAEIIFRAKLSCLVFLLFITNNAFAQPAVTSTTNPTTCGGTNGAIRISNLLLNQPYIVYYVKNNVGLPGAFILSTDGSGNLDIVTWGTFTMTAGTYSDIQVSDGVTTSFFPGPYTLTDPAPPAVSASSNSPVCEGGTINLSGTLMGATYLWSGPNSFSSLSQAPSLTSVTTANAGLYTLRVVANSTLCTTFVSTTVVVNPVPTVNTVSNQVLCNGASTTAVSFSGALSATTYNWTNNNTSIGLAANGTGDISSFTATNSTTSPVTATITVTPVKNGCTGTATTFTITVDPTPTVNTISNQALCNGANTTAVAFSGALSSTTYNWTNNTTSIGLAASGTGDISAFTATNNTASPVTATITVTPVKNGCPGTATTFTITVNPTPVINSISNQTLCNTATTTAVNFSSATSGTTYAWTNNATSIGLAANGTGDIAAFTATNTTNSPVTATITVTPTANSCPGTATTFDIIVNPTPTVNIISNQAVCNGANVSAVTFGGPVTGTAYSWTNNTTSIGLAANGTGDITAFPGVNTGTTPVTATVTVTPTANTCPGLPVTFDIIVNPTPTVNAVSNQTVCNGVNVAAVNFSGAVTGTTYSWTNTTTSLGLAPSGTGNITAFAGVNTGTAPITANVTVTPAANSCNGTPISFTITVNPTPTVNTVANQTVCNAATVTAITFGSPVTGTTYAWSNNTTSIGLAANGTGNIASFTGVNTGTVPVIATVTVTPTANSCPGTQRTFTIRVNPRPTVNSITNRVICHNLTSTAITFTGPVSGTTYAWTNNNITIGLAANGTGNLPSFTALNTGTTPVVATITITPTANSCPGTPRTFTITVNPRPSVNAITTQVLCNGTMTSPIVFSGPISGTTYNWTNSIPAIGITSGTGNIAAFTATNTGTAPVNSNLLVTAIANGCASLSSASFLAFTVNPSPVVTPVTAQSVCDGASSTAINFTSATTGTAFTWTNDKTSIGLSAGGTGNIPAFTVTNPGVNPVVATIAVTPVANSCVGPIAAVYITANPIPVLTSALVAPPICSSTPFNYLPGSATSGTSFSWSRPAVAGISNLTATGIGNPAESLINTIPNPVNVKYNYTLTANGCSNSQDVSVTVNPKPRLSSALSHTICSGDAFVYTPTSLTTGTTYSWARASVSGITPTIGFGNGGINEILANSNTSGTGIIYNYTLTANGCNNSENLNVLVNTVPATAIISVKSPADLCANTQFQNFSALAPVTGGNTYLWTADQAVIWIQSPGKQSALISFPTPGTDTVRLTTTIPGTGCTSVAKYPVNISTNNAQTPEITYYNNRFICLQNNMDTYRWGYDDKITLDSTIISNETNQDYLNPDPDLINRNYWVITTRNGCMQKSYYNAPTTVKTITTQQTFVKVYPNPASSFVNIEFETAIGNNVELRIYDLAGKVLRTMPARQTTQVDISMFAEGLYFISCVEDGVKIATAKFTKH